MINKNIGALDEELEENTLDAFAWIFYGPSDEKISFVGLINDSKKGSVNYESIKVFKPWDDMMSYIQLDVQRFERLWQNLGSNIKVYKINEAIKAKIISLRNTARSYDNCKDYIARFLIATEAKLQGISENDANDLESLMTTYVDSHSKMRLNIVGERRLNQYAARGYDIMRSRMLGKHRHLEEFLLDYFECFENGEFLR